MIKKIIFHFLIGTQLIYNAVLVSGVQQGNSVMDVKVKVAHSCSALCDPMDYTVHGILQARILEWVAFPFSRGSPNPGIKLKSPSLQVDSLPPEPQGKPNKTLVMMYKPFSEEKKRTNINNRATKDDLELCTGLEFSTIT